MVSVGEGERAHKLCAIVSCTQLQWTQKEKTLRVKCPHVSMVISEISGRYAKHDFEGNSVLAHPRYQQLSPSSLEGVHI